MPKTAQSYDTSCEAQTSCRKGYLPKHPPGFEKRLPGFRAVVFRSGPISTSITPLLSEENATGRNGTERGLAEAHRIDNQLTLVDLSPHQHREYAGCGCRTKNTRRRPRNRPTKTLEVSWCRRQVCITSLSSIAGQGEVRGVYSSGLILLDCRLLARGWLLASPASY